MEILPEIKIQDVKLYRALNKFSQDPNNVESNIVLAKHYFSIKEYGSVISFLNRINELSDNDDIVYESLVLSAECCDSIEDRTHQIKTSLAQAIALCPERPEAYYKLCKVADNEGERQQAYSWICVGINNLKNKKDVSGLIKEGVKDWMYYFHKARFSYWMWRMEECRTEFYNLYNNPELKDYPEYYKTVVSELKKVGWPEGKDPNTQLDQVKWSNNYELTQKLEGFPNVYFLTKGGAPGFKLENNCTNLGIQCKGLSFPSDGRIIEGDILSKIPNRGKIDLMCDHIDMINLWLKTTNEEWAIFGDDSMSFELVDKWDFVWKDFINSLSDDCGIVQLMTIRYDNHNINFTYWNIWDWGGGAYLMNRKYAEKLIKEYKRGEHQYNLTLPPPYHHSLPEVFLYREDWGNAFKFSCIVEAEGRNDELHHISSRKDIIKMWEEKYTNYNIKGSLKWN